MLGQLSPSVPVAPGVVQSIKDHITKPTAMARGRVAHLIEWKGWSAPRAGWAPTPAEDEHYCCLPDELREARFAAGQWGGTWPPRGQRGWRGGRQGTWHGVGARSQPCPMSLLSGASLSPRGS